MELLVHERGSNLIINSETEALKEPPRDKRLAGLLFGGRHQSLVALGSFFVSFLVLTALIPVLVRELGAREYGAWVISGGIANYVLVLDFGLSLAVTRFVARYYKTAPNQADEAVTIGLSILLVVGAVMIAATTFAAPAWQAYLHVPDSGFALRAGGIATIFVLSSTIFQSALEGAGIVSATRIVQAIGSMVFVGGAIGTVLVASNDLVALSVFLVLQSILVSAALGLLLIRSWGRLPLRWPKREGWHRILGYAITMQGSAIFVAAVDPLSRFLVAVAAGPAAVAPVDIALRARAQLFGSALAFTRPFLAELGSLDDLKAAAARAQEFWQRFTPVAVAIGLFSSIASYFLVPALLGKDIGHSAGQLTAAVSAMWVPALTAIVPYLFVLLYANARDILVIQALNSLVGIGLMAGLLAITATWAPIIGLGTGSIVATLVTLRIARRRGGREDLFRPLGIAPRFPAASLVAPFVAGGVFFLPAPLYLRCIVAFTIWGVLSFRTILRLIQEAS